MRKRQKKMQTRGFKDRKKHRKKANLQNAERKKKNREPSVVDSF